MHKSPVRLIRRHAHRQGNRNSEEEDEDDAAGSSTASHKRAMPKQHLKRQRDRADQVKVEESLVLNVIDAKPDGENLATNRLATKGAEKLPPITLGSYVTPAAMLPTPLYPPSGAATPDALPTTLSLNTAHQSQGTSTEAQDKFYWSLAVGIMFTALILIYSLSVIRSLVHAISSGILRRGWYLRSSIPEVALNKSSYALPKQRISKFRARTRWFYNCYMLPTIPWFNLTLGQCGVIVVYLLCIVIALFIQTGGPIDDVIRSGRIAVAQYPFLFALATKNNLLGITGKSYEKLIFLHRFAGRSTLITGLVHSAVYLQKWKHDGKLDIDAMGLWLGVAAGAVSVLILFTSLQIVRNFAYQVFMTSHIIGWIALLVSSYLHVEYARPWVWASVAIMGLDFAIRLTKLRFKTATLHVQEGGVVRIEVDDIKSGWRAGQHVWVRRLTGKSFLEVHPLSIANSAEYAPLLRYHLNGQPESEGMVLYSKVCGRWTRNLYESALGKKKTPLNEARVNDNDENPFSDANQVKEDYLREKESPAFETGQKIKLLVDGPYGLSFSAYTDFESVMLVAGGSGITFTLNAIEEVIASSVQSKSRTRRVKIIFTVRDMATVDSFLYTIEDILISSRRICPWLDIQVEIYETTQSSSSSSSSSLSPMSATSSSGGGGTPRTAQLTATTPHSFLAQSLPKGEFVSEGMKIIRGARPNLTTCLSHLLNDTRPDRSAGGGYDRKELGGGVALVTCGPISLISASRKAARGVDQNLAYRAGGIVVHSEKFGW